MNTMIIQLNSDKNLNIHEKFADQLKGELAGDLARFADHVTRLEVYLADENGSKEGKNDKRCVLEAKVEGRPPTAVTAHGDTYELAVTEATHKLKHLLDKIADKAKSHQ